MSSVVISGNTSGTITLDAPAVAGTTTLTLPTTNGTVLTNGTNTNFPAGSVLQVVSESTNTTVTSSTTSFADTGLTATITPSSSSNKILVLVTQRAFVQPGSNSTIRLLRASTNIFFITRYGLTDNGAVGNGNHFSVAYLDSPATTSAITYKTEFNRTGSSTVYMQLDSDPSTITLMEIKG